MIIIVIIIIVIIIIISIIIIAFKGAIPDFFLQSPHCTPNRLQHVLSSVPGAIVCKSRATHRALITCNMSCYVPRGTKEQLSYTVLQSLNRVYLSFILLAEPWTDQGGEETGVPGENPWRRASAFLIRSVPEVYCACCWDIQSPNNRLVGLVVKESASRAKDPGFKARLRQDLFGVES